MSRTVDRDDLQRLVAEHGTVVAEVLPRAEYQWAHLAGAVHLPLKAWDVEQVQLAFALPYEGFAPRSKPAASACWSCRTPRVWCWVASTGKRCRRMTTCAWSR